MNPTKIERLYAVLKGYEEDVNDLANSIAFLGQDLGYVLKELKEEIEITKEKHIEDDGVDCEVIE